MSKYVDVYLLPVPKQKLAKYRALAKAAGKVFRKKGAITYREYLESDLKVDGGITPFTKAMKLKKGEALVYAAVEYRSESHRNKVIKSLFEDPDFMKLCPPEPLFDVKRMVYGGFKVMVDV